MYPPAANPSDDLDRLGDEDLMKAFAARRIAPASFRHRHHVRIAFLYLQRYPLGTAIDLFRRDLRSLAERGEVPGLYHETLTLGYLLLVHERMAGGSTSWPAFAAAHPDLLDHRGGVFERLYAGIDLEDPACRRWFRFPSPAWSVSSAAGPARVDQAGAP